MKGGDIDTVDALRDISLINSDTTDINITTETLYGRYCVDKLDSDTFPLTYIMMDKYQR